MAFQPSRYRCFRCGELCEVVKADPHNFDWRCACGNAGRISWASKNEPPQFEEQIPLFTKETT